MWIAIGIVTYLLFWVTCIVSYAVTYVTTNIQVNSFSQVLYTLSAGTEGAENTIGEAVSGFFANYWFLLVAATALFAGYIYICIQRRKAAKAGTVFFKRKNSGLIFQCSAIAVAVAVCATLGIRVGQGYDALGIAEYLDNKGKDSVLYDERFVEPNDVQITFPEEKRNLIYIVVESMESSYMDPEHGGGYDNALIQDLYDLAKADDGTDFTVAGTTELNGGLVAENTGWTVAGLVAQSSGVTLNIGNAEFNRNFEDDSTFLPHVTTLGDILESEGYSNYFMCGSPAEYAGRSNYYEQHGDYEIYDINYARRNGWVPGDYFVWWGFEDKKLYDFAEQQLTEIAAKDEPFNFTMLTADTHFEHGYLCEDCPDDYGDQYQNVVACSSKKIADFVNWCKTQDFYDNTTIVICGDHLSMDGSVAAQCGDDYQRHVYTAVINGPEYTIGTDRTFTTLDLFPTIVEALGADIEGHRLGLGTSLYSHEPTLVEEMGLDELNQEISRNSDYYNNVILSGDTSKRPANEDLENSEPADETTGETAADPAATAPSAQAYIANVDSFSDPSYSYNAAADTTDYSNYYYTSTSTWTPAATTPSTDQTVDTSGGDTSGGDTSGGDGTGSDGSGSGNTGGDTSGGTTGGDNTGGDTSGGDTSGGTGGDTSGGSGDGSGSGSGDGSGSGTGGDTSGGGSGDGSGSGSGGDTGGGSGDGSGSGSGGDTGGGDVTPGTDANAITA